MDKKNIMGMLFFMAMMGVVLSGMVAFQPEKKVSEVETAAYHMNGFPVLPSEH